jgi:hypothetical protein
MTVSCSGTKLISATGFGLAFGRYTAEVSSERIATASSDAVLNPWLILALVAIVVGLVLSFLRRGKGSALLVASTSAAGVVLIWLGTGRYSKSAVLAEASKHREGIDLFGIAGRVDRTINATIQVDWHFGFYLALLALIAAAAMALLVFSGRDGTPSS